MAPATPDWFADDPALRRLLPLYLDEPARKAAEPLLGALGTLAPARLDGLAREADRRRPRLAPGAGPGGQDTVLYDASYRELQRLARAHRVFTLSWHPLGERAAAPRTLHFALGYLFAQAEAGYYCPGCMTDGAAWVLARHAPAELRERYLPGLVQDALEGAAEGAMLLTERAGGSDLSGTATRAEPDGAGWRLHGEKYFASNCTAEVILALARLPGARPGTEGLGLFLVPRWLPDGTPNEGIRLARLKDKLGVTSMATAELEFQGTRGFLLAGEGRGFKAMADMVNLSRLYNAVASVAVARRALRVGVEHGQAREAFGAKLQDLPLYRLRLLGLALEVEGALAVVLEAADALDRAPRDPEAARQLRALTPLAKACTARLAVRAASEACEFLGGNGYIEDASVAPRLLRDAQVLPIWEGTTNVQALDFLRAARQRALEALQARAAARLQEAARTPSLEGTVATLRAAWAALAQAAAELARVPEAEQQARAWRLAQAHYHTVAATLLAWAASRAPPAEASRAVDVAGLYTQAHVAASGEAGLRALEGAVGRAPAIFGGPS